MKRNILVIYILMLPLYILAQNGTIKICPNTPTWNANASMYNNEDFMYNDYAKGPNGCWWYKQGVFATYAKGQYIFKNGNAKVYYTYTRKNGKDVWSSGNACVKNPFTGRW
ncbi:MAG: hypothetical protein IPP60_03650 [Sphingobacteriales bacterium]|nr:hypothetical protein [Sphingobacteriales bacterium]